MFRASFLRGCAHERVTCVTWQKLRILSACRLTENDHRLPLLGVEEWSAQRSAAPWPPGCPGALRAAAPLPRFCSVPLSRQLLHSRHSCACPRRLLSAVCCVEHNGAQAAAFSCRSPPDSLPISPPAGLRAVSCSAAAAAPLSQQARLVPLLHPRRLSLVFQPSVLASFWKFLRPHTIRGTLLGTTAVRLPAASVCRSGSARSPSASLTRVAGGGPCAVGEPVFGRLRARAPGSARPAGFALRQRLHCGNQPGVRFSLVVKWRIAELEPRFTT